MKYLHRRGFTLIELLVVISIIGMLSSVVLVGLQGAREKAVQTAALQFDTTNYRSFGATASAIWDFDSPSVLTDTSGNNNSLVFTGTPATVSGVIGNALRFNGSNYADSAANVAIRRDYTLSAWVNPASGAGNPIFLAVLVPYLRFNSSNRFEMSLRHTPGSCTQANVAESTTRKLDTWYHVTMSHNDATGVTKLYVNGKEAASHTGPVNANCTVNADAYVGNFNTLGFGFTGAVDSVRIYPQTLAASDVERMYAMEAPQYEVAKR